MLIHSGNTEEPNQADHTLDVRSAACDDLIANAQRTMNRTVAVTLR